MRGAVTSDATRWADAAPVLGVVARMRGAADVRALFARASAIALEELPFERALVLTAAGSRLTADDCGALADEGSDRLRRRVLAAPIELTARTAEAAALGRPGPAERSVVAEALGENVVASAPVAPDGSPLALLVVLRDADEVTAEEAEGLRALAAAIGIAVQGHLLHARQNEVATELRHLMVTTAALLEEMRDAPLVLPSQRGSSPMTAWPAAAVPDDPSVGLLSEREVEIVERLVAGRSNREIADELFLSPDTVKGHVARILRKLEASNRVEAVTRYLALTQGTRR